jgi:formate hydrogenlyase transcriptional activator
LYSDGSIDHFAGEKPRLPFPQAVIVSACAIFLNMESLFVYLRRKSLAAFKSKTRYTTPGAGRRAQRYAETGFGRAGFSPITFKHMNESEERFRAMIDSMPAWAWSSLPDGSTEFLNQSWFDYTGLPMEEGLGWGWKVLIHPDDLEKLLHTWQRLLASGQPGEEEARLQRFDGEYRWFLFRAVPVRNERGEVVRWYGTNTDIENLKRAESLLSAEKRTLEMIGSGASLQAILETLCSCLDAQSPSLISAILLADPDSKRLQLAAGVRVPKEWAKVISPVTIGPCAGSCGTAAFLKKQVITSDIATDPLWAALREVALENGLRAAWSQPIISSDNNVLGTFCIYCSEPRIPALSDKQLLERVAHVALIAIERERSYRRLNNALEDLRTSEAKLKRDEAELRQIVDLIPQIIIVIDAAGVPLYANRVALDYLGVSPQELPSVGFGGRFSHPEDVEAYRTIRQQSLARGVPFELEQRISRQDGSYRWFLFHYKGSRDEHGMVLRWYVTATDIHDRKRAEEKVQNENLALREEIDRASMFEEIVGSSEALRKILLQVTKVAPGDSTVLILGETGTGKELIARAIHKRSGRSARAFIRVNCAAIPAPLIASELFGHEKGAFTGASQRRVGRFESANGGTIFLDEIGDLPAETQIALLRVLQEHEFERLGSNQPVAVDVRVLAATHRDLGAAVAAGTFREDLFYRLNIFPIKMPPLRERVDDIVLLVEYLVERYAKKLGKNIANIEKKTLKFFQAYRWPGNVRELQNVVERAVILCDTGTLSVDETWFISESARRSPTLPERGLLRLDCSQEKNLIEAVLAETKGRVSGPSGAAVRLGIPRQTLEAKIAHLGVDKHRFRSA